MTNHAASRSTNVDTARSVPITYEGKNGKQYVAVMAGGGNTGSTGPGRLYVWALP